MSSFTQGSTRIKLTQNELARSQASGSTVLDSRRTRPLWFDGRFLAARDLAREQNYFLLRQAELGTAAGFGVIHGLWVNMVTTGGGPAAAETIVIQSGQGVTPSGELVVVTDNLTIRLSDLTEEENLDVQFGISEVPRPPARTRTGLFVIALRPVEFTANPITSYPTTLQGSRTTHDSDIVEATAVSLVPYPDPSNGANSTSRRAALARQIFLAGNPGVLADSLLPLAMISITRGAVDWVDSYLVRRDSGPEYRGVRFGLTDTATQQAFLLQYDSQLQEILASRRNSGIAPNLVGKVTASDYFQALPPVGRFPLASIGTTDFSQVFFPQQLDVRLSLVPEDELPALIEDGMSLPPIDLTLAADAYANLSVVALIPVPREGFAALKKALPEIPLNPTLPQVISFRQPIQLLRLYQGIINLGIVPAASNNDWAKAVGTQTYGYYIRRRSTPAFVDFTTPTPIATTTTLTQTGGAATITFGQSVQFTATVAPGAATGKVQFMDGFAVLGSVDLAGGVAVLTIPLLPAGVHAVKAVYAGDANFMTSSSAPLTVTVAKATVTMNLSSNPNPSNFGQSVLMTASLSNTAVTGTVTFIDGTLPLGTASVIAGTSSIKTTALSAGTHAIAVVYSGDANFNVATGSLGQVVNAPPTTTTLAPSTTQPSTATSTTTPTPTTTSIPATTTTALPTSTPLITTPSPTTTTQAPATTTPLPTTTATPRPTTTRVVIRTTPPPGTTFVIITTPRPIVPGPIIGTPGGPIVVGPGPVIAPAAVPIAPLASPVAPETSPTTTEPPTPGTRGTRSPKAR